MTTWLNADATFGVLAFPANAGASSIDVAMEQGAFPVPTAGEEFSVCLNPCLIPPTLGAIPLDHPTTERQTVIGVTGSGPFVLALSGTLGQNHLAGEYVVQVISAAQLAGMLQASNNLSEVSPAAARVNLGSPFPNLFYV